MSTLFTDDFNRADSADLGATWTPNTPVAFQITSNTARSSDGTSDAAERNSTVMPNDQWAEATLSNVTGGGSLGSGYGPAVRMDTGGANTLYRLVVGSGGYQLGKMVAGAFTSLGSGAGTTFTTGDKAYLEFQGSVPVIKKNGTSFGTPSTDSTIASGASGVSESSTTNAADGIDSISAGGFDLAVALTGTATTGIQESDIVAGGKTVIATVTGDTYIPSSSTPGIALRGTGKVNNAANGGNVVLTFDVGNNAPQQNDLVIVFGGHGNAVTTLLAPGQNAPNDGSYTQIDAHTGSAPVTGVWLKKMGATPDTKVTCSGAGSASDGVAYAAWVFQNVDPSSAQDATATVNNATSTNPNPASITTNTNGAMVLAIAASRVNDTTPGTVTNYANQLISAGNDTNPMTVSGMVRTIATAGPEDPAAYSSWSSGVWRAVTVALKPLINTPFNNVRQEIINGMVGDSSDPHNWNVEVKGKISVNDVVRTNNTVCTITLDAEAGYDITANETVTMTMPNNALNGGNSCVATPSFVIAAASSGGGPTITYPQLEHVFYRGARRGILLGAR